MSGSGLDLRITPQEVHQVVVAQLHATDVELREAVSEVGQAQLSTAQAGHPLVPPAVTALLRAATEAVGELAHRCLTVASATEATLASLGHTDDVAAQQYDTVRGAHGGGPVRMIP